MPNKYPRQLKISAKDHAVFLISDNDGPVAKLICLAPVYEVGPKSSKRQEGLERRIKQVQKEKPDVPLLIYQFPIDSLQLIFSELTSFMGACPNSLRPISLEQMKKRGVKVWESFWDWQAERKINN